MSWTDYLEPYAEERMHPVVREQADGLITRVLAAGAVPPLAYKGAGGQGAVFCDSRGRAYKAATHLDKLGDMRRRSQQDEHDWLVAAGAHPATAHMVPRVYGIYPELAVLERDCVDGERPRWGQDNRVWEQQLREVPGWLPPEGGADQWIVTPTGPVMVDGGFARRAGSVLGEHVQELLDGRRPWYDEAPKDLAWELTIEAQDGRLDPEVAAALLRRLRDTGDTSEWTSEEKIERLVMAKNPGDEHRRNLERLAAQGDHAAMAALEAERRRAPKRGRPAKGVPTDLNLWALSQAFKGASEVPNQLMATEIPHIRRCMKAGLVVAHGPYVLRLTPAGHEALIPIYAREREREAKWPRQNPGDPWGRSRQLAQQYMDLRAGWHGLALPPRAAAEAGGQDTPRARELRASLADKVAGEILSAYIEEIETVANSGEVPPADVEAFYGNADADLRAFRGELTRVNRGLLGDLHYVENPPRSKLCQQGRHDFDETASCRRKGCDATLTRTMFDMTPQEEEQAYGFSVDRAALGFRPGDDQQALFNPPATRLPEDPWRYFLQVPGVQLVPLSAIRPIRAREGGIERAGAHMLASYEGRGAPRKPIELAPSPDGHGYVVADGNSTYANAVASGWSSIPATFVQVPQHNPPSMDEDWDEVQDNPRPTLWRRNRRTVSEFDELDVASIPKRFRGGCIARTLAAMNGNQGRMSAEEVQHEAYGCKLSSVRAALAELKSYEYVRTHKSRGGFDTKAVMWEITEKGMELAKYLTHDAMLEQVEKEVYDTSFDPQQWLEPKAARDPDSERADRLYYEVTETPMGNVVIEAHDVAAGKNVGRLELGLGAGAVDDQRKFRGQQGDYAPVIAARVHPSYRRHGVGTKLYEKAAQEAERAGLGLASPDDRTRSESAFWRKQERRRRAKMRRTSGYPSASRYFLDFPPPETLQNPYQEGC